MINPIKQYCMKKFLSKYNIYYDSKNRQKKGSLLVLEEGVSVSNVSIKFDCLEIGAMSYIRSGAKLLNVSVIGRFCSISNNAVLGQASGGHPLDWVSTHPFQFTRTPYKYEEASTPLTIGHDVWIGQGAIIMEGVHIGTGAVVSAQSLVTRDVPPYSVVMGIPARVIKTRHPPETVEGLMKSAWWELPIGFLLELPVNQPQKFLSSLQETSKPNPAAYKRVEITRNNYRQM